MDRPEERLALIEILETIERHGRVARAVDVLRWPLTLGRALDNHIVLDDPYAAAHHARIEPDAEGRLLLHVFETRNGIDHDGRRLDAGKPWPLPPGGATLQIGATRLRLRLPGEALALEKPLPGLAPGRRLVTLACGVALLLLQAAVQWISLDPGVDYSAWLPTLVGLPLVLVGWCGAWAFMSKLFQHRFDFGGHLRIALPWLLAIGLVDALWPQLAAAAGTPRLWQLASPLQGLLAALLVRAHLQHVLPLHLRAVTAAVAALAVSGAAISLGLTWRAFDSFATSQYMSTLPLPALRLTGSVPPATLVQDMAPLAAQLKQRVLKAKKDEETDGGDGAAE